MLLVVTIQEYKLVLVGLDANGCTPKLIPPFLAANLKNNNSEEKHAFVDTTDAVAFQELVDFAKGVVADLRHALGPCAFYGPIIR